MLTKQEAIELIANSLPDDEGILHEATVEYPFGWAIYTQSKKFIETKDSQDGYFGYGGTLVEKDTGRRIDFGSGSPVEENIEGYELGYFEHDFWDLVITKIYNFEEAAMAINYLRVAAVDENWIITKNYNELDILKLLRSLPCTFKLGSLAGEWQILESFKAQEYFEYFLQESQGPINHA